MIVSRYHTSAFVPITIDREGRYRRATGPPVKSEATPVGSITSRANSPRQSISPLGVQEFQLLPAQNTSGNWVKVVQRITVRIRVDRKPGDPILRAGMSVTVDIDTGHKRSISDLL